MSSQGSRLLSPYRAVGLVSGSVPFHVTKLGTEHFVTVALDKFFHVYNCDRLRLVNVGRSVPHRISSISSGPRGDLTFTANGPDVTIHRRSDIIATLSCHTADVTHLYSIGSSLLSMGSDRKLCVWDIADVVSAVDAKSDHAPHPIRVIDLPHDDSPSCICHPETYLNKVVIGFTSGAAQIYNIHSGRLVYRIREPFPSAILRMAQSPIVDVIAFALANGDIVIHNILTDTHVATLTHGTGVPVTAVAFRTDGVATMVSGGADGSLIVWDLAHRQMLSRHASAHNGRVVSCATFPGEPVLLTSGSDNRLSMWVFDGDGIRLLKSRSGHTSPPSRVLFHDRSQLLSYAGTDLRTISLIRDERNCRLSDGGTKLPPITAVACSDAKEKQWDNVLTCHEDHATVYTWSYARMARGKKSFTCPNNDIATCVCISACGNFGFVGTAGGAVHKFNMQSGMFRGSYPAVSQGITGVACDAMNTNVVVTDLGGSVRICDFRRLSVIETLPMGSPIALLRIHHASGLIAVACDDMTIRVIDLATRKIVRRFSGHTRSLTDVAFSADAGIVVSACTGGSVRAWDMPTGACFDWMQFTKQVTSLSVSPAGDFVCTTHAGSPAVFVWANNAHFSTVFMKRCSSPRSMAISTNSRDMMETADADDVDVDGPHDDADNIVAFEQLLPARGPVANMLTLSSVPESAWRNLGVLDEIKKRNRPTQPVQAPPTAPFFLPTVSGLTPSLALAEMRKNVDDAQDGKSKRMRSDAADELSSSFKALVQSGRYEEVTALLASVQSASALDLIVRSIGLDVNSEGDELLGTVEYLIHAVEKRSSFELVQAFLGRFLSVHQGLLSSAAFASRISVLHDRTCSAWRHAEEMLHSAQAMLAFFSGIQL
ncbi:unnamed protein product (mitochondrion) [Plasmodiophora brassicae]|uniref:Uncharacterized protein n=1 Tax=Plasmodiophora brassicae TaxID=37360 RepID=A0A0G4J688_PLABS|nr:hypothetical protein PBRA_002748 [Plasmodiophora brassicae]SPQ94899.1 unnamed protein product [Plasmodiophora brassicae]